jgi:carbamoyltransferase
MMKILAVNPGHNGSACLVEDGKVLFYVEEERLSRFKYDGNTFRAALEALQYHKIDILVLGGTGLDAYPQVTWTGETMFHAFARKYNKDIKVIDMTAGHHLGHAASAFYNSGFDEAISIVVDGCGTISGARRGTNHYNGFETETAYKMSYPGEVETLYQSIFDVQGKPNYFDESLSVGTSVTITKAYEAVSHYLGFGFIEAGKTMGLAPYGKEDPDMPKLFDEDGRGNPEVLYPVYPSGALIRVDTEQGKYFQKGNPESRNWHRDPSKVTDIAKDLAWQVQEKTQQLVGDIIEKMYHQTGIKNICISGGYGLNCMANYYYKQRFPELNIFCDPAAHDGGTVIGLAKLVWYRESESTEKYPLETLYLGPEASSDCTLKLDEDKYKTSKVDDAFVAKLIADKNIVAYFRGRSEAGPRALGNRSILYTSLDPDGKDTVNMVKGREWFRPFAGSMLAEHFEEWFETYGMTESPFMMYAMDFKEDKKGKVPSITHVDGTCRIQTVTPEQNSDYYNLINEFYKLTGTPIIFNTSFNLAGEPLVETIEDAIHTLDNCDINYLYLPETQTLVEKIRNAV